MMLNRVCILYSTSYVAYCILQAMYKSYTLLYYCFTTHSMYKRYTIDD
jgi:hypothetical protein